MNSKWKTAAGRRYQANQKAYKKRKAFAAVTSKGVPAKVKDFVKRAIDAEIQDKQDVAQIVTVAGGQTSGFVRGYGINSSIANSGLTTISVIPPVPIGTDEDKRTGNVIKPKSLVVNYTLNATPIDTGIPGAINQQNGMPYYVAVIFYSRKDSRTSSSNVGIKDFGSVNFSFDTINDFLLPFNKEMFNIHSFKKYKMYPSQSIGLFGTTQTTDTLNSINGYVPMVMKSQKLSLPAKLLFDDNAQQPTNARIYCAIGVFNIDNSTPARADTVRVKVEMNSVLTYQNA